MKYRVVGWTDFNAPDVKGADSSEAAIRAIICDIREHGYKFASCDHQERPLCAPVLNDGCKRLFSRRSFGHVMAWAQGDFSPNGYLDYAFDDFDEQRVCRSPDATRRFDPAAFVPEGDLAEHFCYEVDRDTLDLAKTEGHITLPDEPALLMIDSGDTLTLTAGDRRAEFAVLDSERGYEQSEEEFDLYVKMLAGDLSRVSEWERYYEPSNRRLYLSLRSI